MFPRIEGFKIVARHQCYPLEPRGDSSKAAKETQLNP